MSQTMQNNRPLTILIVCKEKMNFDNMVSPIIKTQADSLVKAGHQVDYFIVSGGKKRSYLRMMIDLRKQVKKNKYMVIHAHFSITAIFAALSVFPRRIVVSLMGSDTVTSGLTNAVIRFFSTHIWKKVILKSESMRKNLRDIDASILPNGVNFEFFKIYPREEAAMKMGYDRSKKHILFIADPARPEKNIGLAKQALGLLKRDDVEFHVLWPVKHDQIPWYMNASDLLLLTSTSEGSPNVIKEAMACNLPIVATDVGDVRQIIGNTRGCFISSFEAMDVAEKIRMALNFGARTTGRQDISHLSTELIAQKLTAIYRSTLTADELSLACNKQVGN